MPEKTEQKSPSRAQLLLQRLIASNDISINEVADELVVTPHLIGLYMNGERPIPLARQMCLAKLCIDRVPKLARQGYSLQGQVQAVGAIEGWVDTKA